MNTINQTDKELKRIEAKQTLGFPLTAHETASLTLYGIVGRGQTADNDAVKESARKAKFVAEYLSPLLRAAGLNINNAEYRKYPDSNEEIVTVKYESGFARDICVTADSFVAIVADVLEAL